MNDSEHRAGPVLHLLLLGLALGALLPGLADAAAAALGGGDLQSLLATGTLLLAAGCGARKPRGCRRFAVGAMLWLGAAGLLLPVLVPPGLLAGRPLSLASLASIPVLWILLGWPAARVGAHLADRLEHAGAAWSALLFGLPAGAAAVTLTGLGPAGWVGLCLLALVLMLAPLGGREDVARTPAAPTRPGLLLAALGAGGAAAAFLVLFLLPHLALFDASTAPQDARRLLALALLLWLGAWTVGTASRAGRLQMPAAALLACALGWMMVRLAGQVESLSLPEHYLALTHQPKMLSLLGKLGQEGPLQEWDAWHAPVLLLWSAGPALILLGGLLRTLAGDRAAQPRPGQRLTALLAGAGLAVLVAALAHPLLTPWRLAAAAVLAAAAGILGVAAGPLPLAVRGLVGVGVAALAVTAGLPRPPATGLPFQDRFLYEEAGVEDEDGGQPARGYGQLSVARVLERNSSVLLGNRLAFDGRNRVDVLPAEERGRRLEVLLPLALTEGRGRALLAGTLHPGGIRELRAAGVREVHLACEPPELVALARDHEPDWQGIEPDGVTATVAESEGPFDLVLVREPAPWDTRRALLERSRLAAASRRLATGGVLAVVLDLERCTEDLPGAVARALRGLKPAVDLWLVPDGLRTPRLLLTARENAAWPRAVPALLQAALAAQGLRLEDPAGLRLLRPGADAVLEELPRAILAAPLPPALAELAGVAPRPEDKVAAMQRAGGVLATLEPLLGATANDTLLPFLRGHLEAQVLSMEDRQFVEEWRQIDLSDEALDGLQALTLRHPGSRLLRGLWQRIAPDLGHRRDVVRIQRLLPRLMDELAWRPPELLVAVGESWLEMLDAGQALAFADEALAAVPEEDEAGWLRARALVQLGRPGAAAETLEGMCARHFQPRVEWLRTWGEQALEAGLRDKAVQAARRLEARAGKDSLGPILAELLGYSWSPDTLVHPEKEGD